MINATKGTVVMNEKPNESKTGRQVVTRKNAFLRPHFAFLLVDGEETPRNSVGWLAASPSESEMKADYI